MVPLFKSDMVSKSTMQFHFKILNIFERMTDNEKIIFIISIGAFAIFCFMMICVCITRESVDTIYTCFGSGCQDFLIWLWEIVIYIICCRFLAAKTKKNENQAYRDRRIYLGNTYPTSPLPSNCLSLAFIYLLTQIADSDELITKFEDQ